MQLIPKQAEKEGVTAPRRTLPARTYLITRRCLERRFYLRPDPSVTRIFEYLLAVSCVRYEIELHAFVVMSNHYHLVVTDRHGHISDFQQYLNSLLARSVNAFRGRWGAFWDYEPYNSVDLLEPDAVLSEIAYTELNPVKAGLVSRATDWEGASSAKMRFGHKRVVQRPDSFFRDNMPEQAVLELVAPHSKGVSQQQAALEEAVAQGEQRHRSNSSRPMGMRRVMAQRWQDGANSKEKRRQLRPRFAGRTTEIRVQAIAEYQRWLRAYRSALQLFRAGDRDVEFPLGTYWMCAKLGCPRAPS